MKLQVSYSPGIILLSFGISFLSSYLAISLCEQLRVYKLNSTTEGYEELPKRGLLLILIAISLGGIGIWCMHFIGMHALTLKMEDGTELSTSYNVVMSIISLIAVLITTITGVFISSRDVMFSKTKNEIIEVFIRDAVSLSMEKIRKINPTNLLLIVSTQSLRLLLLGGMITGSGVSIMHYLGMMAMQFEHVRVVWSPGVVAASVLIAIIAATAAFWILFRLLSIFPEKEILRIFCALLMAVAVCGMHYTGMVAASFEYDPASGSRGGGGVVGQSNTSSGDSFLGVLLTANILLWLLTILLFTDLRKLFIEKSRLLRTADELLARISGDIAGKHANAVKNYVLDKDHSTTHHGHGTFRSPRNSQNGGKSAPRYVPYKPHNSNNNSIRSTSSQEDSVVELHAAHSMNRGGGGAGGDGNSFSTQRQHGNNNNNNNTNSFHKVVPIAEQLLEGEADLESGKLQHHRQQQQQQQQQYEEQQSIQHIEPKSSEGDRQQYGLVIPAHELSGEAVTTATVAKPIHSLYTRMSGNFAVQPFQVDHDQFEIISSYTAMTTTIISQQMEVPGSHDDRCMA